MLSLFFIHQIHLSQKSLTKLKLQRRSHMGQPDLSEKGLTSHPDVAADIVNVFVYNGKQVIHETDLKPYVTNEAVINTKGKLKGLYRDNCMEHIRNGTRYAIFGFENQDDIDYTMPLRVMGYDYSVYARQVAEFIAQNRKKHPDAFIHKLLENQKIKPVVTLVFLYQANDNSSQMPQELLHMIDMPDDISIQKYVSNYKMNFINLQDLSDEQLKSFHSDFAFIAKYLNKHYNKKQLLHELQKESTILVHPKDTLYTLASLTKDNRYLAVGENIKEESTKMCEIADALEKIGYEKGLNIGIETGSYQKLITLTCRKLKKGHSVSEIADMLEEDHDTIQKIYDIAAAYAPDYDEAAILAKLQK